MSVLLLLPAAACVSAPSRRGLEAAGPVFVPQTFFTGRTVGEGELRTVFSRARRVRVEGRGSAGADGGLVLVQQVRRGDQPPTGRTWRLRPEGNGIFSGTLTDATGPVRAEVRGNRLRVRFRARGGLDVEQWLFLQPGGETALNRMVVRKFGLPVASLRETIRRRP